jgi:hypothetical protein
MRESQHIILPSGLHAVQYRKADGTTRIEIFTEEEYQHRDWWSKIKLKFNL